MEVQRALGAVELLALLIGALVPTFDVVCAPAVVLLSSRAVPLALKPVQVLVVKALNFESLQQEVVSVIS